jgi:primosomal protein N' (replication factor Y)
MSVLRLAIASPLRRPFDYLPPPDMEPAQVITLQPGVRLRVPFGSREVTGYLLAVTRDSELELSALKPALTLLDPVPLVDARLLELCLWSADYYQHPVGEVMSALFPRALREGRNHQEAGETAWRLSIHGQGLPAGALSQSPRQAQALALLQQGDTVAASRFREKGISNAILAKLREKGLVENCLLPPLAERPVPGPGLDLNPEQSTVMADLRRSSGGFSCHLLEGVTGSGKTEIYLQLIADCLERDQQALVLIPEIGLTPQTLERFRQRFGGGIAVLHSGLSDARRYEAWEAARSGRARIVIGTRSAVFTPLENTGLIIVDEEHDSSYKQQDGFRYSARDVAVKRGQLSACPVLLGSATPSLESIHNALAGRYQLHRLTRRAGSARLPTLSALDLRRQELRAGLSPPLIEAVGETLRSGQQALLFLNRRGYAPTLQCHDCGWIAECMACDARLTVHRRQRRLRCHHCGAARRLPPECPDCMSQSLLVTGLGTEQSEEFLRQQFKQWPVFRVDSDSMQGRGAMQALVEEINRGQPCVLLGTQMLTKGHHFPGVALVAVIDTDALLFSPDFRGEERMAQLLTQVAGRAGRSDQPGRVILQTHYPDHPALQGLLRHSYPELAREMLERRRAAGLPPAGQLLMVRSDCADAGRGEGFLQRLREAAAEALPRGCNLIGPLPSPMQRRAGKFRSQLLLTAPGRREGQAAARLLVQQAEALPAGGGLKWSIDVDPTDVF